MVIVIKSERVRSVGGCASPTSRGAGICRLSFFDTDLKVDSFSSWCAQRRSKRLCVRYEIEGIL